MQSRRIGHDISPHWGDEMNGILASCRSVAANYFWSGRVLLNDPDFVLVDGEANEARVWATMVALAGGDTIVSADMSSLVGWQRELISGIIPPYGKVARPVDLFDSDPPAIWHLLIDCPAGQWHVVALFNWLMAPQFLSFGWPRLGLLPEQEYDVFEFWTQSDCGTHHGEYAMSVPGRSVALLALRKSCPTPSLIGSSMHFTQGAIEWQSLSWNADDCCIRAVAGTDLSGGAVFNFRIPDGFTPDTEGRNPAVVEQRWDSGMRSLKTEVALNKGQEMRFKFIQE